MGFAELAQIGVASWVAGGATAVPSAARSFRDILRLPIIYNFRQALELLLKAVIERRRPGCASGVILIPTSSRSRSIDGSLAGRPGTTSRHYRPPS